MNNEIKKKNLHHFFGMLLILMTLTVEPAGNARVRRGLVFVGLIIQLIAKLAHSQRFQVFALVQRSVVPLPSEITRVELQIGGHLLQIDGQLLGVKVKIARVYERVRRSESLVELLCRLNHHRYEIVIE